jgi:hypothetical protein
MSMVLLAGITQRNSVHGSALSSVFLDVYSLIFVVELDWC